MTFLEKFNTFLKPHVGFMILISTVILLLNLCSTIKNNRETDTLIVRIESYKQLIAVVDNDKDEKIDSLKTQINFLKQDIKTLIYIIFQTKNDIIKKQNLKIKILKNKISH